MEQNYKKTLIIEDQIDYAKELFLEVISNIYGEQNIEVEEKLEDLIKEGSKRNIEFAPNYSRAKELIERNNYDVIFLDNNMPYGDKNLKSEDGKIYEGVQLIDLIKSKYDTKIIGTSTNFRNEDGKVFYNEEEIPLEITVFKTFKKENYLNKVIEIYSNK